MKFQSYIDLMNFFLMVFYLITSWLGIVHYEKNDRKRPHYKLAVYDLALPLFSSSDLLLKLDFLINFIKIGSALSLRHC